MQCFTEKRENLTGQTELLFMISVNFWKEIKIH